MPAVSQAQHGFAAMSRTAAGRKKLREHGKKPMPESVAKEYTPKGQDVSALPKRKSK